MFNHLYTTHAKSSNSNSKTTANIDSQLAFDDHVDRTRVNKDQFREFESDYHDSQDNSSLADPWHVEFEWQI
jgi:hypothetical protein